MAVTEVDHWATKERIKEILESNDNLHDEKEPDGKIREIALGVPSELIYEGVPTPYIRITNHSELEIDTPYGSVVNNEQKGSYHKSKYMIICAALEKDTSEVEKKLDGFHKLIKETLKGNVNLSDPSDNTDPKGKISFPFKTEQIASGSFKGQAFDGFVITLQVESHTV